MKEFFSLAHILYMLITALVLIGLWLLLRHKTERTQRIVIFSLMIVNVLQHLLKIYIYPQYWGQSFGALSTAYNMCAFLILATPFIYLFGSELWQNFITYVGTVAGALSIWVTYWLADPLSGQIRFVFCHSLLLYTSLLPALLGIYKINYRKCLKLPFVFYSALMILIVNDIITYSLGWVGDIGNTTLHEFLIQQNPCWVMGAPQGYGAVESIITFFTPEVFEKIPLLWYAIPLFLLISGGAFGLGTIFDHKRFMSDFQLLKNKIAALKNRIKSRKGK